MQTIKNIARIALTRSLLLRCFIVCMAMLCVAAPKAEAFSLALDSVAEWGKFPRFCVNTYRWGDKFFNSYDSVYVVGTGTKFNVRLKTESWADVYNFNLSDDSSIRMRSNPSTSAGIWLTYLAVSVGYDMNVSKILGFNSQARRRFSFGVNCSLLSVEAYWMHNDQGTKITRFTHKGIKTYPDLEFNGLDSSGWGMELYYFFNHKRYSQAAAFNFSKIQRVSQGSFYAGVNIWSQEYTFDFNELPNYMKDAIPPAWSGYTYHANNKNYTFKLGYGYNWVLGRHWTIGVSEAPSIGVRKGFLNDINKEHTSFALSNKFRASAVWNNNRWFIGAIFNMDTGLIYDKDHTFVSSLLNASLSAGYRFNIW